LRSRHRAGLPFNHIVSPGGYAWWYLDGLSDCGRYAVTAIAFVGSVFSPYYARARKRSAQADPNHHCALNLIFYERGKTPVWIFREYAQTTVIERTATRFALGHSVVETRGAQEVWSFRERTTPFPKLIPREIVGSITLDNPYPWAPAAPVLLAAQGQHQWWPMTPKTRLTVNVPALGWQWQGDGYCDANAGEAPLEDAFSSWSWGRFHLPDGATLIAYDAVARHEAPLSLRLHASAAGDRIAYESESLPLVTCATSRWGLPVSAPGSVGGPRPVVQQTFEDTPFYARHQVQTSLGGTLTNGVVETLSLDRFQARWVRNLLPFRLRRA